ncbi:Beta and gamma crystallin [Candidatus Koribacter versatilis Ellin345]|uniref:Beta and gamma crystallin n=1 Tax=Koribacter versatilis (strain Ellin345) TaxID=204669 RepID=Q1ILJ9_KORVE|nr:beta and gamma crystallin [Candidatus Koribacter versatilis]ABF42251.1 Beta and gamma crystallin [Candidatus Koribacter versatilis Ellin345]
MGLRRIAFALFLLFGLSLPLLAQGPPPRDGACFYREENFRGRSFCVPVGESVDRFTDGFDNGVYSVQVFGRAEVIAFNYFGFTGVFTRLEGSVPNLHTISVSDDRSKSWAGRISSVQVNFRHGGFRPLPPPSWGRPEVPRSGACFYHNPGFQGDYFCMSAGESYESLPGGFNDSISSIRVFGGGEIVAFNDPGFGGLRIHFRGDVQDLSRWRTQDNPYKNWNNRISSIQVLGAGWKGGTWYPGGPR